MNRYPSDEELNAFIEQLEQQELYAPKNMKEEILKQAFPKQTVEVLPRTKSQQTTQISRKAKVSLFSYRLKIVAGMAAAIVMLIVIPMQDTGRTYDARMQVQTEATSENQQAEGSEKTPSVDVKNVLNESTRKVNQKINTWTENFNNLFEINRGGNVNEN